MFWPIDLHQQCEAWQNQLFFVLQQANKLIHNVHLTHVAMSLYSTTQLLVSNPQPLACQLLKPGTYICTKGWHLHRTWIIKVSENPNWQMFIHISTCILSLYILLGIIEQCKLTWWEGWVLLEAIMSISHSGCYSSYMYQVINMTNNYTYIIRHVLWPLSVPRPVPWD